jgi:hypothetical protein
MSLASAARLRGFMVLLSAGGEDLTYRAGDEESAEVSAIVNRRTDLTNKAPQMPQFATQDETTIELLKTAMGAVPETGMSFFDAFGHAYRIQTVKRGEHTYLCTCEGSDVPAE